MGLLHLCVVPRVNLCFRPNEGCKTSIFQLPLEQYLRTNMQGEDMLSWMQKKKQR